MPYDGPDFHKITPIKCLIAIGTLKCIHSGCHGRGAVWCLCGAEKDRRRAIHTVHPGPVLDCPMNTARFTAWMGINIHGGTHAAESGAADVPTAKPRDWLWGVGRGRGRLRKSPGNFTISTMKSIIHLLRSSIQEIFDTVVHFELGQNWGGGVASFSPTPYTLPVRRNGLVMWHSWWFILTEWTTGKWKLNSVVQLLFQLSRNYMILGVQRWQRSNLQWKFIY